MNKDELVIRISVAISRMEGWDIPGSVARRHNNPGNLRRWKGVPVEGGYASFPTEAEGWKALRNQVARNVGRKLTLIEFFSGKPNVYAGYAPAADNNKPRHYAEFVAKTVGIPADVPLSELIEED